MDADLFFPGVGDDQTAAKGICAGCLVRAECLAFGLREGEGIWGGQNGRERRKLRGRRAGRKSGGLGSRTVLPEAIEALPVDERGLVVLQDVLDTLANPWTEHNYLMRYKDLPSGRAISEALAWLRGRAFIARIPGNQNVDAIFVTARGQEALTQGIVPVRAAERLGANLHPLIEQRARPQFLLGAYEQAVLVAMKTVEVRVRSLGGFGDDMVGVALMTQAFRTGGPLTDPHAVPGEQVGTMNLFQGAYAVLRNPASHREVNYDDVTEASEAVATASLLMRILDRVELRIGT
jgi:uncharacterized protein (TIGR02391 family)